MTLRVISASAMNGFLFGFLQMAWIILGSTFLLAALVVLLRMGYACVFPASVPGP